MKISRESLHSEVMEEIEETSGERLSSCYQCGKCSAGCPMISEMEYPPHQIVRFLHLGDTERAFKSKAIWLCASCHSCASRCPQSFDLSNMMEALRVKLLRSGELKLCPEEIDQELLKKAPQQAFIGAFRKYSN